MQPEYKTEEWAFVFFPENDRAVFERKLKELS